MLTFEWNALRVGDHVLMHDPQDAELGLIPGTVLLVETKRGKRVANGVGMRVDAGDRHEVLWPPHHSVHRDPVGPADDCWRCQARKQAQAVSGR